METHHDRSNRQGQNFGDNENIPNDMVTPNAEKKPGIDIDKINDDFLADDRKEDSNTETETGSAPQQYEQQDISDNRRGKAGGTENFTDTDNPDALSH